MARDVNKDRRLGFGLGLVLKLGPVLVFFTVFILIYTNKLMVSYGSP